MNFLAQITTEWVGPSAQVGSVGVLILVLRWFMSTVMPQLRSMERSMDLLTRANLLMGIAQDEASSALKAKLQLCLAELDDKERETNLRRRPEHEK